jgi:hypothetical protein
MNKKSISERHEIETQVKQTNQYMNGFGRQQ